MNGEQVLWSDPRWGELVYPSAYLDTTQFTYDDPYALSTMEILWDQKPTSVTEMYGYGNLNWYDAQASRSSGHLGKYIVPNIYDLSQNGLSPDINFASSLKGFAAGIWNNGLVATGRLIAKGVAATSPAYVLNKGLGIDLEKYANIYLDFFEVSIAPSMRLGGAVSDAALLFSPFLLNKLGKLSTIGGGATKGEIINQASIVTRLGHYDRSMKWFNEAVVIEDMMGSNVGQKVVEAAKANKFRLEFSKSYFQQSLNAPIEYGLKGNAFQTKAKIYLPVHSSNMEVAETAIHEGIHVLGVAGSRRAEALARFAELQHRSMSINYATAKNVLRDIRTATDVYGNRVYMQLPWKLGKESVAFPGYRY